MSYSKRVYMENYYYHVFSRGQRGQPLFFSPEDRIEYMKLLDCKLERGGASIGSFCLMSNHMHLLIQMGKISLGDIFRDTNSKYARGFNRRRGTFGHVVQSPPGVKIVLRENYLMELVSYIHRNPLEAGIVEKTSDYKWSSWYWFKGFECDWIKLKSWRFPPGFEFNSRIEIFKSLCERKRRGYPIGKGYIGTEKEWKKLEKRKDTVENHSFLEKRNRRTIVQIAQEMTEGSQYTIRMLRGRRKNRKISFLRHRVISEMWREGHSQSDIARFFRCSSANISKVLSSKKLKS